MGLAFNGKKVSGGVALNGQKIVGIAYKGDIIYYNGLKMVTFADGTDEEIASMLEAHYQGKIDISKYWSVGDTRTVQLTNLGSSGSHSQSNQKMTMVIIGINHDNLKEPIGIRDKAAITVQCRELLGSEYYWGENVSKVANEDNYTNNPLRNWLNGAFVNAMPLTFGGLVKTVNKKNLKYHTKTDEAPIISEDKAFLLSYPEVFGSQSYTYYKGSQTYEGTQYKYYQTSSNRIKYDNDNGNKGGYTEFWWLRSPASFYGTYTYTWITVNKDGQAKDIYPTNSGVYLAPAFCL